ncbi:MAG: NCS1 family nucleobase:cation symporter-1 [Carbonactinosporaceae bacterium]
MAGTALHTDVVVSEGRFALAEPGLGADDRYHNVDLTPVAFEKRTWSTYNYAALWMGIAHNIPSYLLASGLVALGMDWLQAVLTIALGNLVVLIPMLLNSHAGTKYGIPFPVFARAAFGVRGAHLAALLRGFVACGWFGIQTWVGGQAIFTVVGTVLGAYWTETSSYLGYPWTVWLSFAIFWVIEMAVILRGMDFLRRWVTWSAPFVVTVVIALACWMVFEAGGVGPLLSRPSELGWGPEFWPVFFPSLMGMIAFWATMSLNMSDFTRYARGQTEQTVGQSLGLPTTMTLFAVLSVFIASATAVIYREPVWDPVALAGKFHNAVLIVFALVTLVIATLSANVAANTVAPANAFSNLAPRIVSFRLGCLATGVIGIAIQPWRLLDTPELYIFTWLGFYGGLLGPLAGVLVADYWLVRRTRLSLAGLYRAEGPYWFARGWNWRAIVSFLVGAVLAVGGSHSAPGAGPFPEDGLVPLLAPVADYGLVAGMVAAFAVYSLLGLVFVADDDDDYRSGLPDDDEEIDAREPPPASWFSGRPLKGATGTGEQRPGGGVR